MNNSIKNTCAALICLVFSVAAMPVAFADGGGGGGSIGGPAQSGPSYDPVEKYQQGVEHLQNEEYKKAERAFKKVLKVVKKDANTHYLLGLAYVGQEKTKKARRPFERALKYDDSLVLARGHLGAVYHQLGNPEKAEEQKQILMEQMAQCDGCADKDKLAAALHRIELAGSEQPQSSIQPDMQPFADQSGEQDYLSAVKYINRGEYHEALQALSMSARKIGPHPDILTYQGFANRKLENYNAAIHFYRAALSIDDNHRGANEYLGEYYVEMGNLEAAHRQLSKLERICAFGCEQAEELRRWITAAGS